MDNAEGRERRAPAVSGRAGSGQWTSLRVNRTLFAKTAATSRVAAKKAVFSSAVCSARGFSIWNATTTKGRLIAQKRRPGTSANQEVPPRETPIMDLGALVYLFYWTLSQFVLRAVLLFVVIPAWRTSSREHILNKGNCNKTCRALQLDNQTRLRVAEARCVPTWHMSHDRRPCSLDIVRITVYRKGDCIHEVPIGNDS